jgi:hypothetical protein
MWYTTATREAGDSGDYIQEEPLSYHKTELGAEMRISEYMIADIKNYKSLHRNHEEEWGTGSLR